RRRACSASRAPPCTRSCRATACERLTLDQLVELMLGDVVAHRRQRAVRLERRVLALRHAVDALLAQGRAQLLERDALPLHVGQDDLAVAYQRARPPLHQPLEPAPAIGRL